MVKPYVRNGYIGNKLAIMVEISFLTCLGMSISIIKLGHQDFEIIKEVNHAIMGIYVFLILY